MHQSRELHKTQADVVKETRPLTWITVGLLVGGEKFLLGEMFSCETGMIALGGVESRPT